MKKPKNLTEQEVIDKISLVINRIAPKYTFHGYDIDDIKQEAFIICYEALERYDQKRPLENFLSVNLSNRLKNFIRDNNFTKSSEDKRKVLSPKQLVFENLVCDEKTDHHEYLDEVTEIIDSELPPHMRADYLKIMNNIYIPKKRRLDVLDYIRQLLEDKGYA
jgi:RNA polymerase sigma factor (sigma-70 family)